MAGKRYFEIGFGKIVPHERTMLLILYAEYTESVTDYI